MRGSASYELPRATGESYILCRGTMKTPLCNLTVSGTLLRREISRFIRAARERSEFDVDRRRRARRRYRRSWPLLVAPEGAGDEAGMCVALYNASPLGIAFLCPRPIPVGTTVLIKLFWHDESSPFVPALVHHATRNHHGHIIGCSFVVDPEPVGVGSESAAGSHQIG